MTSATIQQAEINGKIDTNNSVLDNINLLALASGCFITWDPNLGKWSVIINGPSNSSKTFNDSNIIGNLSINGSGISELYNKGNIEFPNTDQRDTVDFVDLSIPESEKYQNELDNNLSLTINCINNPIHAQLILSRELKQNRLDKIVQFLTDYTANGLKAGEVISITNSMYGFTNKKFRIITIEEEDSDGGDLLYNITAIEYDASIYDTSNLIREYRSKFTGIKPIIENEPIQQSIDQDSGNQILRLAAANLLTGLLNELFGFNTDPIEDIVNDYEAGQLGGTGGSIVQPGQDCNLYFTTKYQNVPYSDIKEVNPYDCDPIFYYGKGEPENNTMILHNAYVSEDGNYRLEISVSRGIAIFPMVSFSRNSVSYNIPTVSSERWPFNTAHPGTINATGLGVRDGDPAVFSSSSVANVTTIDWPDDENQISDFILDDYIVFYDRSNVNNYFYYKVTAVNETTRTITVTYIDSNISTVPPTRFYRIQTMYSTPDELFVTKDTPPIVVEGNKDEINYFLQQTNLSYGDRYNNDGTVTDYNTDAFINLDLTDLGNNVTSQYKITLKPKTKEFLDNPLSI